MRLAFTACGSVALLALASVASGGARRDGARSSFVVGTTVVDACRVSLQMDAIRAACSPGGLAHIQAGASLSNGAPSGFVSLVPGGAPMRIASSREGRTHVITFSF